MTALGLYKFVKNNSLEYHWSKDGNWEVILFIPIENLKEWNKLLGPTIMDEDGIACYIRDGYFSFYMFSICEYFGLDLEEIFGKRGGNLEEF